MWEGFLRHGLPLVLGERAVVERRCGGRSRSTVVKQRAKHVNNLFADAQKFFYTPRLVRLCNPTCMTEGQVLSMCMAVCVSNCEIISCDHNDYGPFNWEGFSVYLIWRNHVTCASPTTHLAADKSGKSDSFCRNQSAFDGSQASVINASSAGVVEENAASR